MHRVPLMAELAGRTATLGCALSCYKEKAHRPECLCPRAVRSKPLASNAYRRGVRFVAFVLHGFFGFRAKRRLIRIFRRFAVTADYLFAAFNANQPVRFPVVPGNFHSIGAHIPSTAIRRTRSE